MIPSQNGGEHEDGPFTLLTNFLTTLCESPPQHMRKIWNLVWSAMLHAIVVHGANAIHEISAFGLESSVYTSLLGEWNAERGAALQRLPFWRVRRDAEAMGSATACRRACST